MVTGQRQALGGWQGTQHCWPGGPAPKTLSPHRTAHWLQIASPVTAFRGANFQGSFLDRGTKTESFRGGLWPCERRLGGSQ